MNQPSPVLLIPKESQVLDRPRSILAVGLVDADHCYLNYLRDIGYLVEKQETTRGLHEQILANIPNVLLLDMDGLGDEAIAITHQLKENPLTYTMPILIVIGNRDLMKEIETLEAGAEDFVAKPFPSQVLAARIHTSMRRNIRLQVSNPLTGLPGAIHIEEQTTKRLEQNQPVAMCYVDLDNFKAFNDKYSYNRGDNVIRILATILNEGVVMFGRKGDFVGHIGGDDFIMITDYAFVEDICKYVTSSFDMLIPFQYEEDDMNRGYIVSVNRQGVLMQFPLMTVSIGVVTNQHRKVNNYLLMTELAAEMKQYAKTVSNNVLPRRSIYRIDQRAI
jgi:diguanylate cyclase (GGDEF)-like protein